MTRIRTARPHRPDDSFSLRDRLNSRKVGGTLLLAAAAIAFALANSPLAPAYFAVRDLHLGIPAIGLDLSIGHWASDGVLAIFFFVVGIELKREFVTGSLRDPRRAALPIAAAVAGMAVPAALYTTVMLVSGSDAVRGWAIPVATDIAFALALLAVFGKGLPSGFRTFLLTLAVVDDLLGIIVIAIFYTAGLSLLWLLASLVGVALYWLLTHRGINAWWIAIPLGLIVWYCMLQSGVHATIAGVLLGLSVPALPVGDDEISLAEDMEHDWNALSQGVALPVFAFFAAGVPLAAGGGSVLETFSEPVFLAVALGLVVGKPLGIVGSVALLRRVPGFALDPKLKLPDVLALGAVAGIGFTVSLLIGELAFRSAPEHIDHGHLGVIVGSVVAAVIGSVLLRRRSRAHRRDVLAAGEERMP